MTSATTVAPISHGEASAANTPYHIPPRVPPSGNAAIALVRANQALLGPLGDGPANIMGMIRMTGAADSAYATTDAERLLAEPMMTMQEFLAQKVSLPVGPSMTSNLKTA